MQETPTPLRPRRDPGRGVPRPLLFSLRLAKVMGTQQLLPGIFLAQPQALGVSFQRGLTEMDSSDLRCVGRCLILVSLEAVQAQRACQAGLNCLLTRA